MSPAKRTTSDEGSMSDNSGVPPEFELFEAIQEWVARDPDAARDAIEFIRERAKGAPGPPRARHRRSERSAWPGAGRQQDCTLAL